MRASLIGGLLGAGLLLRGAWDPWALWLSSAALSGGTAAWLAARALRGRLPLPPAGPGAWCALLAGLSLLSAGLSPVPAYALPGWAAGACGLGVLLLSTRLSAEERESADRALRAAGWALVVLAAHQRLNGAERPAAALLNQNVFAGVILMLLPAAAAGGFVLPAALLLCLLWTRSAGAWLGLALALAVFRRRAGPVWTRAGMAAGAVAAASLFLRLGAAETLHRPVWWRAAWRMAASSPWLGVGPGCFAYALPAYAGPRPDLSSLFAHQHFLETAAEKGWPYLLLWAAGLSALLARGEAGPRFGALAALVHGLVDYPLSVPGPFWLFCHLAGRARTREAAAIGLSGPRRPAAAAALAAAGALTAFGALRLWKADRLRASAAGALACAAAGEADLRRADRELARSQEISRHPEAARLRGDIAVGLAARGLDPGGSLRAAAGHYEEASRLDPYRASSRARLEAVRRKLAEGAAP